MKHTVTKVKVSFFDAFFAQFFLIIIKRNLQEVYQTSLFKSYVFL
jgi:hypothetical protein